MKSDYLTLTLLFFVVSLVQAQQNFQDLSEAASLDGYLGVNIGMSVTDYNMDGLDDFYVSCNGDPNLLFRNNGDGTFTEVADDLGIDGNDLSYTAGWGDIDNDGDPDLYVGNRVSADQLYRNNGDGTFSNITQLAGIDNWSAPRSVHFADIDMDGLLDIYISNINDENVLYHNDGYNTFSNQVVSRGATDNQISMGAILFDYDQDGDPDLYLAHDNNQPNILYQNDGLGYFTDVSELSGTNYAGFGMGVDVGDINNDGFLDMYITNLYDNTLLLNQGDGTFTDITSTAGINDPGMGWSITFIDYDNDGFVDIYVVNDTNFSPLPNLLYRNLGDNTFEIVSEGQVEQSPYSGYGSASLDFNKDGLPDLLVSNFGIQGGIQYFQNVSVNDNNWFQLKLEGVQSNRDAIGARITLQAGELMLTEEVIAGSGYASQNSLWQHFGLGAHSQIDLLTIHWPSGVVDQFEQLEVNQALQLTEGNPLVGTSEFSDDFSWAVHPNPAQDWLTITLKEASTTAWQLDIYRVDGQKMLLSQQETIPGGQLSTQIALRYFPAGVYVLCLKSDGFVNSRRFVKH